MKVRMVSYAKVFPLAAYVNERIGVEIELDDTDNEQQAFSLAKELVNGWGEKRLADGEAIPWATPTPEAFDGQRYNGNDDEFRIPRPIKKEAHSTEENIIQQIMECSDLKVLDSFKLIASKSDKLTSAFNQRKKQLGE